MPEKYERQNMNEIWCARDQYGNYITHGIRLKNGSNATQIVLFGSKKEAFSVHNASSVEKWNNGKTLMGKVKS